MSDESVLDTIWRIHAAGLDPALWPDALSAVNQLVGGIASTVEVIDRKQHSHREFHAFNLNATHEQSYVNHYAALSPRNAAAMRRKPGEALWDYALIEEREIDHSEFYVDFLRPMDMRYIVAGILYGGRDELAAFSVQRSARQGHVQHPEIRLVKLLIPHVSQALEVTRRIRHAESGQRSLKQVLDWLTDGVVLLDGQGKVYYVNSAFEKISRTRDGIALSRGALEMSTDARDRLRSALTLLRDLRGGGLAGRGSDFSVARPSGMPPYLVSVRPLVAGEKEGAAEAAVTTMVFVRDPTAANISSSRMLKHVLGLTDAEVALAAALCAGVSPSQYAASQHLSPSTVYTHLSRIKLKAGCRRMAELIRRLNDLQAPARYGD